MGVSNAALSPTPITRFWQRADAWMAKGSEYLSPILVKEARQALKSKQFIITFSLLLICGWAWSILGVAIMGPEIHFQGDSGMFLFLGYEFILLFPLVVIVPFSAYRSLASEWEDGTYEMISVTTLRAWQIIGGKLGSAILQMVVYLSALLPFLAFTNMLRGIDVVTIAYVVFWTVMACLFNTIVCLCVATITRDKIWQIVFSVALIAKMLGWFVLGIVLISLAYSENVFSFFDDWEFWLVSGIFLTAVVGFQVLFFLIARARLLFPSQNRSTAIRVTMMIHQAIFAGWMGWAAIQFPPVPYEAVTVFVFMLAIYWFLMGMFLTGENPQLSQRVKRSLPQSFLGRMFCTWFNPGSGTGYFFVVGNLAGAVLLVAFGLAMASFFKPEYINNWDSEKFAAVFLTCGLSLCYLTIYLGTARLFLLFLRRFAEVGVLLAVLINVLLYLVGELVPLVVSMMIPGVREEAYSLLQFPSPGFTIYVAIDSTTSRELAAVALLFLLLPAAIIFMLNFIFAASEIRQFRMAAPKRVQQEEAVLRPKRDEPTYRSPWDEDEPALGGTP